MEKNYVGWEEMGGISVLEEVGKPYNISHRSYHFAKNVINFVRESPVVRQFSSLYEQLVRSATSIGANLVEGNSASSKKDWLKFLVIALKSANETKYWLCLIRDTMNVSKDALKILIAEADELSKIIASIILNARRSNT